MGYILASGLPSWLLFALRGGTLDPLGAYVEVGVHFSGFPGKKFTILEAILVWKSLKVVKQLKSEHPESSLTKSLLPDLAQSVQKWILYRKNNMF